MIWLVATILLLCLPMLAVLVMLYFSMLALTQQVSEIQHSLGKWHQPETLAQPLTAPGTSFVVGDLEQAQQYADLLAQSRERTGFRRSVRPSNRRTGSLPAISR